MVFYINVQTQFETDILQPVTCHWVVAGLRLFVTNGLPDAQSEKQLGLLGMRLENVRTKEVSDISPIFTFCHAR